MFYTQKIDIIDKATANVLKTLRADVQPISNQAEYFQYGYTVNIEFRIYCNSNSSIALGTIIQYKNIYYQVMKVLDWGTYMEILIDKYSGAIPEDTGGGGW